MRNLKLKNNEGKASQGCKKLEGRYANYFKIGHNAFEFVIDFGQYHPGSEDAELYTRIITSPFFAQELSDTLLESIHQFEQIHGTIKK